MLTIILSISPSSYLARYFSVCIYIERVREIQNEVSQVVIIARWWHFFL